MYEGLFFLLACNFIEKRLLRQYFSVNVENIFATPILKNTCKRRQEHKSQGVSEKTRISKRVNVFCLTVLCNPANNYLFKPSNRKTRTLEKGVKCAQWCLSGDFIVNFENISRLFLVFYCWLWLSNFFFLSSSSIFWSSLIYNTSARHEWHECDTSATPVRHEWTRATRVQHKCDTSAKRVLHERHECDTNEKIWFW